MGIFDDILHVEYLTEGAQYLFLLLVAVEKAFVGEGPALSNCCEYHFNADD